MTEDVKKKKNCCYKKELSVKEEKEEKKDAACSKLIKLLLDLWTGFISLFTFTGFHI